MLNRSSSKNPNATKIIPPSRRVFLPEKINEKITRQREQHPAGVRQHASGGVFPQAGLFATGRFSI